MKAGMSSQSAFLELISGHTHHSTRTELIEGVTFRWTLRCEGVITVPRREESWALEREVGWSKRQRHDQLVCWGVSGFQRPLESADVFVRLVVTRLVGTRFWSYKPPLNCYQKNWLPNQISIYTINVKFNSANFGSLVVLKISLKGRTVFLKAFLIINFLSLKRYSNHYLLNICYVFGGSETDRSDEMDILASGRVVPENKCDAIIQQCSTGVHT